MTLRPRRSKRQIVCSDFFKKSERIYFAAPPSQITTAALGCDLGSPLCGVFRFCRNIGFNRYFYAYREDFTYPAEVNSACAKVFECPPQFEQFTWDWRIGGYSWKPYHDRTFSYFCIHFGDEAWKCKRAEIEIQNGRFLESAPCVITTLD